MVSIIPQRRRGLHEKPPRARKRIRPGRDHLSRSSPRHYFLPLSLFSTNKASRTLIQLLDGHHYILRNEFRTTSASPDPHSHFPRIRLTRPGGPSRTPFFEGAINLKQFIFNSKGLYPLSRFVFPNLTTFELSTRQHGWTSDASDLFDFLKASPKLRTVEMMIDGSVTLGSVPQETVTVFPNVETFSLSVGYESDVYEVVARISCPCAKYTSLNLNLPDYHITPGLEIFPTPASWNMITRQYARSLV